MLVREVLEVLDQLTHPRDELAVALLGEQDPVFASGDEEARDPQRARHLGDLGQRARELAPGALVEAHPQQAFGVGRHVIEQLRVGDERPRTIRQEPQRVVANRRPHATRTRDRSQRCHDEHADRRAAQEQALPSGGHRLCGRCAPPLALAERVPDQRRDRERGEARCEREPRRAAARCDVRGRRIEQREATQREHEPTHDVRDHSSCGSHARSCHSPRRMPVRFLGATTAGCGSATLLVFGFSALAGAFCRIARGLACAQVLVALLPLSRDVPGEHDREVVEHDHRGRHHDLRHDVG